VFATLPVNSRVPFGMAIQADWLLDLSRRGLRDLQTNAWQRGLVIQIAKLLSTYVTSIRGDFEAIPALQDQTSVAVKRDALCKLFDVVCVSSDWRNGSFELNLDDKQWLETFASQLVNLECLPIVTDDTNLIGWNSPARTVLLPATHSMATVGSVSFSLPRYASHLLSHSIVDRDCINQPVLDFFKHCGLLKEMAIQDLLVVRKVELELVELKAL